MPGKISALSNSSKEIHSTFYHLFNHVSNSQNPLICRGTACFAGRHRNPELFEKASVQAPPVYCLGRCYAGPADEFCALRPPFKVASSKAIVLETLQNGSARTIKYYRLNNGYMALKKALGMSRDEIVREVEQSGLRGRGGAGFPTGQKWRIFANENVPRQQNKLIIANADEGDPGAYIDRFLMEDDPFRLIEAMTIAGYATGATEGIIYIRHEYPEAHDILLKAINEAKQHNYLGSRILESDFSFDLTLFRGHGSYVCGEETSLVNSIEGAVNGRRPEPRPRPPYLTESGLFGKPTLVNNVETLVNIPWIVLHGGLDYHSIGFSRSRGTKVVSLNSLFRHPGLYEIEFGMPVRKIIEELGGGLAGNHKDHKPGGLIIGGPLAGVLHPDFFDTPFGFEELRAVGASVGHGGIVAFDEKTTIGELVHHVFSFGAFESCGKCTPCRLGSRRIEQIFAEKIDLAKSVMKLNDPENKKLLDEFSQIVKALRNASFCGLGTGLADFADSILKYYPEELSACFK